MKYYLHDSNSFNDEKVTELYIKFGYEGLGLFYTMLEKFAAQEKPIKTQVLKKQLDIGKRLEKCWSFMEEIGLIQSLNGETFNERILNFAGKYKIKNKINAERVSQWRENQAVTKNVTHNVQECNADKVNKSKVKESKVNKSKDINTEVEPSLIFISDGWKGLWAEWKQYRLTQTKKWFKSNKYEQMAINKLVKESDENLETAQKMVVQSMEKNWIDIYKLKIENNVTTQSGNQSGTFDKYRDRLEQSRKFAEELDKQRGFRP
jgi:hypothetical protein